MITLLAVVVIALILFLFYALIWRKILTEKEETS